MSLSLSDVDGRADWDGVLSNDFIFDVVSVGCCSSLPVCALVDGEGVCSADFIGVVFLVVCRRFGARLLTTMPSRDGNATE